MLNKKVVYLLVFLIVVLLIILVIRVSNKPKPVDSQIPRQSNQPEDTQNFSRMTVSITSSDISTKPLSVVKPVKLSLSRPISAQEFQQIKIDVSPSVPYNVLLSPDAQQLIVEPTSAWVFNTSYKINVSDQSPVGQNKLLLDQSIVFTFETQPYSGE